MTRQGKDTEDPPWRREQRGDRGPSMEGAGLRGRGLYPGGRAGAKVWEGQETGKPARFMEGPLAPLPYPFP